jgi:2-succinyl-6-hydroxy-2,4-cyclohexadiene-1-carboxylate synthase
VRLALVHGFTQTGRSWEPVLPLLPEDAVPLTPDLPGHGGAAGVRTDLRAGAEWLADQVGPAVWLGYSMGGRYCLHVALHRPEVVHGLILVSTTAGIDDERERAARRDADEELAKVIEAEGVAAFLDRWLAAPLFASLPPDRAGREARLANTADGLASSLRLAGTGTQESLWSRLHEIEMPTLVVTGGRDTKFTAVGDRLAACIPRATHAVIPGAGHAVPWEEPHGFAAAVNGWLTRG